VLGFLACMCVNAPGLRAYLLLTIRLVALESSGHAMAFDVKSNDESRRAAGNWSGRASFAGLKTFRTPASDCNAMRLVFADLAVRNPSW